jgi:hypothetical protein
MRANEAGTTTRSVTDRRSDVTARRSSNASATSRLLLLTTIAGTVAEAGRSDPGRVRQASNHQRSDHTFGESPVAKVTLWSPSTGHSAMPWLPGRSSGADLWLSSAST